MQSDFARCSAEGDFRFCWKLKASRDLCSSGAPRFLQCIKLAAGLSFLELRQIAMDGSDSEIKAVNVKKKKDLRTLIIFNGPILCFY